MSDTDRKQFAQAFELDRERVERRLVGLIAELGSHHDVVAEAVRYCALGGGKRLRPVLCLWSFDLFSAADRDREAATDAACALEFIHTYSLVHDDLPCMDDDDTRRGRPSCHVRFGEAVAVLTGDALLTLAFSTLGQLGERWNVSPDTVVTVLKVLATAAGTEGLIKGQALDLTAESAGIRPGDVELVEEIHRHKTAALIAAAMETGAVMAGADEDARGRVRRCGMLAGSAFQIVDDVLDGATDKETLGKTPGKDIKTGKLTYATVAGGEEARRVAGSRIAEAKECLPVAPGTLRSRMERLLDFIVERRA